MSSKVKLTPFLFLLLLCLLPIKAIAQSSPAPENLSPAESWILSQIGRGKRVDLASKFPNESDRVLRPAFLQALFTKDVKDLRLGREGVQLENGIVKDDLDLEFIDVPYSVGLFSFRFERNVWFSFGHFRKSLNLEGTTFAGPVFFEATNVDGNILALKTRFTDPEEGASFRFMRVGGVALFHESTFDGPAQFSGVTINDLDIRETLFNDESNPPDFFDARFGTLQLNLVTTESKRHFAGAPRVEGMTFERAYSTWGSLSLLCRWSEFSPGFYSHTEAYLRKIGNTSEADELFIAQKQRERKERLGGLPWLTNLFLDLVVGYGRKPQRALYLGLLIIALGCVVFLRKQGMTQRSNKVETAPYNPFWYSLDLFAPVIDLQAASNWMPEQNRWFARNYVHVHRIFGWILVPIGIAAWTGILK